MAGIVGSDGRAGVYWRGNDGNVYIKDNTGAVRQTVGGGVLARGDQMFGGLKFREIDNPNPTPAANPSQNSAPSQAPANPNGGGGGGYSGAAKVDRTNDIRLQEAGLSAADEQQSSGIAAVDKALQNILGQYATESAANEKQYGEQSDNNQNQKQKNTQVAYVNAAQGRRGLFGTLSSIGALNGDAIKLANRAVQTGANADLSGAGETFATNKTNLDTSIDTYRRSDETRKKQADIAAEEARTGVKNNVAKTKQTFYSDLANNYADMGDTANARKFTELASSLYPTIAQSSIPSSNLTYNAAAFSPGTLANYIAGQDSTAVGVKGADAFGIPGLVASPTRKKQLV